MADMKKSSLARATLLFSILVFFALIAGWAKATDGAAAKVQVGWKSIGEAVLMDTVRELCSEKYSGRLTGTKGYNDSAEWLAGRLAGAGLKPGGDGGAFFQEFPNPYTLVLPGAELALQSAHADGPREIPYEIEADFFPGSTSDSGEVTAGVVYVGYGITAPELGYDEYAGIDARDRIVLMEPEVPVDPGKQPQEFARWRPYSFHQYKMDNARAHGAAGVLYNYPIVNPNCSFNAGLLWTAVGDRVVADIFAGSGRDHGRVLKALWKKRRPRSFATGRIARMKNISEHHPEGIGRNVIACMEGSDPALRDEVIVLSAHLDHLGRNPSLMPGANDNASGVAVVMAVAEALARSGLQPRRTVAFIFFGDEEQGVRGSEFYLKHVPPHLKKMKALINLDGVGRGKKIHALAAKNYPGLWKYFARANRASTKLDVARGYFHNRARPRLDAAHFMWAGVPTISFSAGDAPELPYPVYHTRHDRPDILTPGIMADLGRLIFAALADLAECR
ncbi:MAG: M20/M25/M40 family metallo-hydrolase [Acidobacteria bacterium]|nr:M20/M25/M40 family metallo-hydrolase [Acidobacteriota bacterium]